LTTTPTGCTISEAKLSSKCDVFIKTFLSRQTILEHPAKPRNSTNIPALNKGGVSTRRQQSIAKAQASNTKTQKSPEKHRQHFAATRSTQKDPIYDNPD
jgi:hypothetical protein